MNLHEKLLKIQQGLNAPKDQYNSFGKYKYRSAESILQAVKPLLAETKTVLVLSDSIRGEGDRIYICAAAELQDTESDDMIASYAYAREEETKKGMDSSQVTGAASSYARKYALNGLFAIDDQKDSDATNTGEEPAKPKAKKAPEPKESNDGYYYCENCGEVISNVTLKNGQTMMPKDMAVYTIGRFGKQLCEACSKKQK